MELGALAKLPVHASDFASVCFTAAVPSSCLRLVLVRVISTFADGSVADARCRTAALLFDARHSIERLCEAARAAIRTSRMSRIETESLIEATHLYTRVSGSIISIDAIADAATKSVYDESIARSGRLLGAVNRSGAFKAYDRHCTTKSRVCMYRAGTVLDEYRSSVKSSARSELAETYVTGLVRLGVANPTREVPAFCACTGTASCACFMARAIWRAGCSWMIIYAIMPPISSADVAVLSLTSRRLPKQSPTSHAWLDKLLDTTASESEDAIDPLRDLVPAHCVGNIATYVTRLEHVASSLTVQRLLVCDDNDDENISEDMSLEEPATLGTSLVEATVVWLFNSSASTLRAQLGALAKHTNLYYKTSLEHVLATTRRRTLLVRALRLAANAPADATLLAVLRGAASGIEALHALVPLFSISTGAWRQTPRRQTLAMHSCELTGYTIVTAYAFIVCCCQLAKLSYPERTVNTWDLYDFCPLRVL
jgi:hypothetical protein